MMLRNSRWRRGALTLALLLPGLPSLAQPAFEGAPEPRHGVFIKAVEPLDDVRHFCVDLVGHMQGVQVSAPLQAHTCKDGFWNYDGRFDQAMEENLLAMPAYQKCLSVGEAEPGAGLYIRECDASDRRQRWEYSEGRLRLKGQAELCLSIADTPSEVSIGTRNHPVRHLVRPLLIEACASPAAARQTWTFAPPSDVPGVRYPDGSIK